MFWYQFFSLSQEILCVFIAQFVFITHYCDKLKSYSICLSVDTYLLTYSMEQSPSWVANQFSASQEIHQILWNVKAHYCIHKCLPPVSTLSQLDPVHTPTSHFLKIHHNIILPPMSWSPKWSLSLRFPHQNPVYTSPLPHMCYMCHPSHSCRFYHLKNIGWEVQIINLLIT
jgi:hypothetical protein